MNWTFSVNSKYKDLLEKAKLNERASIHSFHRYYGKLIPAIPNAFIKEFTKEGEIVGDLFSGSGTVAVESKILKRDFVGCEINPLSQLISVVKTTTYDVDLLLKLNSMIKDRLNSKPNNYELDSEKVPFCVNRDHWFKQEVQEDLVYIKDTVDAVVNKNVKKSEIKKYLQFYYTCISAVIRNVSNADPATVFPGISIRIRKLESEGKIHKDAIKTYCNAIDKRAKYFAVYDGNNKIEPKIYCGDSLKTDLSKYKGKVSLFVTNPPYISSVRYIETMKLEMYWLKYIQSSEEYSELANYMLGNDKVSKKDYSKSIKTDYPEINELVDVIKGKSVKDAYIVTKYFNDMEQIINKMSYLLKNHGKVVIKISDSKVKKIKVETGKYLTLIAEKHGFKLLDVFLDKINENSRSLTTARNTYSDIILNDNIIIWEKNED